MENMKISTPINIVQHFIHCYTKMFFLEGKHVARVKHHHHHNHNHNHYRYYYHH